MFDNLTLQKTCFFVDFNLRRQVIFFFFWRVFKLQTTSSLQFQLLVLILSDNKPPLLSSSWKFENFMLQCNSMNLLGRSLNIVLCSSKYNTTSWKTYKYNSNLVRVKFRKQSKKALTIKNKQPNYLCVGVELSKFFWKSNICMYIG